MADFNAQYGTIATLPGPAERAEIYAAIFGGSDAASPSANTEFMRLRKDLLDSAAAYAAGAAEHSLPMLREAVRSSHRPLKDYLQKIHGDSTVFSKEVALSNLAETTYKIIRNSNIASIFSVPDLGGVEYPYTDDPSEDLLIEQITAQLEPQAPLTRERISNLRRVARTGTEAIASVCAFGQDRAESDADLALLITKCHVWATALSSLTTRSRRSQSSQGSASAAGATSSTSK